MSKIQDIDVLGAVVTLVETGHDGTPTRLIIRLPDGRLALIDGHPEDGIVVDDAERMFGIDWSRFHPKPNP